MAVSLEKRTENAQVSLIKLLEKQAAAGIDLGELVARVIIAVDFSGSMGERYRNGEVQEAVERSLALSLAGLDDDGDIQVFFFDFGPHAMETVDKSSYLGFVDTWARRHNMGGTNYSKTIDKIVEYTKGKKSLFGRTPDMADQPPVFVIFVTDGYPTHDSTTTIKQKLIAAANLPIFWQFVGLGYSPEFLKELDTMGGRVIDNVGLTEFDNTRGMEDSAFFDEIIREFFTSWLPAARNLGITRK